MKRILIGMALIGIVTAGVAVAAKSAPKGVDTKSGVVDLSGAWRFDPARSDKPPQRMGGGGHGGGMHGGGMHGGWGGGSGGPPPEGGGYRIEVKGSPSFRVELSMLGEDGDHNTGGLLATAMRLLNAIPAVCAAPPRLLTPTDLPLIAGRGLLA